MADALAVPSRFRFGVATAGFQVEGGYNGPGEPANNWCAWEQQGRVEPSGIALDFWNRFDDQLDRAAAVGCDAFRLSVEWARVEPAEGVIDTVALDRYAAILDGCHQRGMQPVVTLHHFTHPAWLGPDYWTEMDAPERFAAWVDLAVTALAGRCRDWVTLNEINVGALHSYFTGWFPPGRRLDMGRLIRALDHMLTAHVLAYGVIKRRQPQAVVSTNNYALAAYELDGLLGDVLLARSHGVAAGELHEWLTERRRSFQEQLPVTARTPGDAALRRLARSAIPLEQALPRAVDSVYGAGHPRCLDVVGLDFYAPELARHLRCPGRRTAGGRSWEPVRPLWDDRPEPANLSAFCRLKADLDQPDLPVWVAENGLCNRVRKGRSYPRGDGWDRTRYLKEHLAATVAALDQGLPVGAYFHWTLADNYEWGSYEPRFGLYGVDRERGLRWLETDSMGVHAAAAYRRIIDGLRSGDRSVLR